LHALNADTLTWRKVETSGAIPQQRANHSSAVLDETNELFVFGGWNGTQRLNDIHILDVATSVWTCPKIGGVLPHPRAGMTLTALRGRLYLFGGSGTSAKCFQDLQILDRNEMAWLDVVAHYDSRQHHHHQHHHRPIPSQYDPHHNHDDANAAFQFGGARMYDNINAQGNPPAPPHHAESGNALAPFYGDNNAMSQQGGDVTSWTSGRHRRMLHATNTPNPNDEDTVPSILVYGQGPGRRAGHTATAVNRKIFIFGGSCT
jgi:Kelch motif